MRNTILHNRLIWHPQHSLSKIVVGWLVGLVERITSLGYSPVLLWVCWKLVQRGMCISHNKGYFSHVRKFCLHYVIFVWLNCFSLSVYSMF